MKTRLEVMKLTLNWKRVLVELKQLIKMSRGWKLTEFKLIVAPHQPINSYYVLIGQPGETGLVSQQ